jgi:hypothetical protein
VRNLTVAHIVKYIAVYGTPYGESGVHKNPPPIQSVNVLNAPKFKSSLLMYAVDVSYFNILVLL